MIVSRSRSEILSQKCISDHLETELRIEIPATEIRNSSRAYRLCRGTAKMSSELEMPCFVASPLWHDLGAIEGDTVNILDYFHKLTPKNGNSIGLVTFQNGIQNGEDDLEMMGNSILSNLLPNQPLCIGLYNYTFGKGLRVLRDLQRLRNEWKLNSYNMLFTRQLFLTFGKLIAKFNSGMRWVHIAHSEAGLMANTVLTSTTEYPFSPQQRELIRKPLTTLTYGAVLPIPDHTVSNTFNTYSQHDIVLAQWGKDIVDKVPEPADTLPDDDELMRNPYRIKDDRYYAKKEELRKNQYIAEYPYKCKYKGCSVTVVKSIPYKREIGGDHGFQRLTYQAVLKENIYDLYGRKN